MRYALALLTSIGISGATILWLPKPAHADVADILTIALCSEEWETAIGIAQTYAKSTDDPAIAAAWLEYADRLAQVSAGTLSFDPAELEQLQCSTLGQTTTRPAPSAPPQPAQPTQPDTPVATSDDNDDDDDNDEEVVEQPQVELISWDYLNGTFVGRVINNGTTPVRFVKVNYEVLDKNGTVIRSSFAVASPTVVAPGRAGQFLSFINQPGEDIEIKPGNVEWTES
jgi:hypothetical protein